MEKTLLDAMKAKGYDPWYAQLLHESFRETGDAAKAVKVANGIFAKHPADKTKKEQPVPSAPARTGTSIVRVDAPKISVAAPVVKVESPTIQVEAPVVNVASPTIQIEAPVINMPEEKERPKKKFEIAHSDGTKTIVTEL